MYFDAPVERVARVRCTFGVVQVHKHFQEEIALELGGAHQQPVKDSAPLDFRDICRQGTASSRHSMDLAMFWRSSVKQRAHTCCDNMSPQHAVQDEAMDTRTKDILDM